MRHCAFKIKSIALFTIILSQLFIAEVNGQEFTASLDASDAFIELNWSIPNECLRSIDGAPYPNGVYLSISRQDNGQEVYGLNIVSYLSWIELNEPLFGRFLDFVGPSQTVAYTLQMYQVGYGSPVDNCNMLEAAGSTQAFIAPEFTYTSDADHPGQIDLQWTNTSDWTTSFMLTRNDMELAYLEVDPTATDTFSYIDVFLAADSTSLVNGENYTYCLTPFSNFDSQFRQQVCTNNLTTFAIELNASDDYPTNKVELNWQSIASFGDQIQVFRDEVVIANISPSATSFTDASPIPGKNCVYRIELLAVGKRIAADTDAGSVPANGLLAGRVLTASGDYPLAGTSILLTATVGNERISTTTLTDYNGSFSFPALYYGTQATFTLVASKEDILFENNAMEVDLNLDQPTQETLTFSSTNRLDIGTAGIEISDFDITPAELDNEIVISGRYSADSDTVFFNLYRDDKLIATDNLSSGDKFSFSDLAGSPATDYSYKLTAFIIVGEQVSSETESREVTFPAVAPPDSMEVSSLEDEGYIRLNWTHNANNFSGFLLYRNEELIADLAPTDTTYSDLRGDPGTNTIYSITAYRTLARTNYESLPIIVNAGPYPTLPVPTGLLTTAGTDRVVLEWQIPEYLSPNYNYTGFKVVRNDEEIGTVIKGLTPFFANNTAVFTDRTGVPGMDYNYEVYSYRQDEDRRVSSDWVSDSISYPRVESPTGFIASQGTYEGAVQLSWEPTESDNIDGFQLTCNEGFITQLNPAAKAYTHYTVNSDNNTYELRAFRLVDNESYSSTAANAEGQIAPPAYSEVLPPTGFQASDDLASSIFLTWSYPTYSLAEFVLSRDEVVLDTLSTEVRSFHDYDAVAGANYLYDITAIYEDASSQKAKVNGRLRPLKQVSGRFFLDDNNLGVPEIIIQASAPGFFSQTVTDSAGYYSITGLPEEQGLEITVTPISAVSAAGMPAPKVFSMQVDNYYEVDFSIGFPLEESDGEVAQPTGASAYLDAQMIRVIINWSMDGTAYDGFEVFRLNTLIGEVEKGEPLQLIDTSGTAGVNYYYKVRAYLEEEGLRKHSEFSSCGATFPILPAVKGLTASSVYEENKVKLSWSHQYGMVSEYQLFRNGELLANLPASAPGVYADTSGIPGQLHHYTVVAVLEREGQVLRSEPVAVEWEFPSVSAARSLQSSVPLYQFESVVDSIFVETSLAGNQLLLGWEYAPAAADSFWLYRDGNLIAQLPGNTLSYNDFTGLPTEEHSYELTAITIRQDQLFEANPANLNTTFPKLAAPVNLSLDSNLEMGFVELRYSYLKDGANGFYILRKAQDSLVETIDTLYTSNDSVITDELYIDKSGTPGLIYQYGIAAFSIRDNQQFYSDPQVADGTVYYPSVPAVMDFSATQGDYFNYINLSWQYDPSIQCGGFEISRQLAGTDTWDNLDLVDRGRRSYTDVLDQFTTDPPQNYIYRIEATREVAGTLYRGEPQSTTGSLAIAGIFPENSPDWNGFGRAVAMDGNYAIVGWPYMENTTVAAEQQRNSAYIYKKADHEWILQQELQGGSGNFGEEVAISGDIVAVGAPQADEDGEVYIYSRTGEEWHLDTIVYPIYEENLSSLGAEFGSAIAISQNTIVIGAPNHTDRSCSNCSDDYGAAYIFQKEAGEWQFEQLLKSTYQASLDYNAYGWAVDIDNNRIAVGAPGAKVVDMGSYYDPVTNYSNGGSVWIYEKSSDVWNEAARIPPFAEDAHLGESVALDQDYLVIGAPGFELTGEEGKAYLYQRSDDGEWEQVTRLYREEDDREPDDRFGRNIEMENGYIMVACNECDDRRGSVFTFQQEGESWSWQEKYQLSGAEPTNDYGYDIALSGREFMVGAPRTATGAAYWYNQTPMVSHVEASDGNYETKTEITWEYDDHEEIEIDGFRVYRDGEFLIQIDNIDERIYADGSTETIPGYRYNYQVTTYQGQVESQPQAAEGHRQANGIIKGLVTTAQGDPVGGVSVYASAIIEGEYYNYASESDQAGNFTISNIYYGRGEADYTLTAAYPSHTITPAERTATLSKDQPKQEGISFLDQTAYIVSGLVHQRHVDCGLDSVQVSAISIFTDGTEQQEDTYTNSEGMYSLVINPSAVGLAEIRIEVAQERIMGNAIQPDTIRHAFEPANYILVPDTLGQLTVKDFTDTLTYQVELVVQNSCELAISADSFLIRVRSEQMCYDSTFLTGADGSATVGLPPLEYQIEVVDVNNPSPLNTAAVAYFENRPISLNLWSMHKDSIQYWTAEEMTAQSRRKLTYHTTPSIELRGFSDFMCNDPTRAAIVQQDEPYTLYLEVLEEHEDYSCQVDEGYLRITNPAARVTESIVMPFSENMTTISYSFTGGVPNIVQPYTWGLMVEYFSVAGDYLGQIVQPIIVEGAATVPGNDIIVDPAEDGGVPFPLFVLRDPPGDNSYSSIAAGQTISKSVSINDQSSGGAALVLETEAFVLGFGAEFNLEIGMGGGTGRGRSWDFEITTNEVLSTSSSPNLVGRTADVIVGAGLAMQYGLVQSLKVSACDSITITFELGFTPHSVSTTWSYTVGHIEGLIAEYQQDLAEVEAGTYLLKNASEEPYSVEESIALLNNWIDNWTQVLQFHDVETLPHYLLCTQPVSEDLPEGNQAEIKRTLEAFCTQVGTYQNDGGFILFEEIVWNDELVDAYNNTADAITALSDPELDLDESADLVWQYGDDAFESTTQYVDGQYHAEYGILAENRTFSGGAGYTRTINGSQSSTKTFNSNFYLQESSKLLLGTKAETESWFGFGGGIIIPSVEYKLMGGVAQSFEYTIAEDKATTETNTVEVSYTLDDDDPDDHFSVTAIQGMSQNHTPYFSLLGGRSSCPGEEGTIMIHDVKFQLYDPEEEVSYTEMTLNDVPADEPATFWVQVINNSPLGDTLNLVAFVDNASNNNGALITMAGVANAQEVPFYDIPPGEAAVVPLVVERGTVGYQHDNIRIGLRPDCSDALGSEAAYLSLSVNFIEPDLAIDE